MPRTEQIGVHEDHAAGGITTGYTRTIVMAMLAYLAAASLCYAQQGGSPSASPPPSSGADHETAHRKSSSSSSDKHGWLLPHPDPSTPAVLMQKLIVTDSDRAVAFYTKALGMKVLYRLEPPGAPFSEIILTYSDSAEAPRIVLSCALRDGVTPGIPPHGTPFPQGIPFSNTIIQVPDLPEVLKRIVQMGGTVPMQTHRQGDYEHGGLLLAFARDPDGHVLELMQFTKFDDSWPVFDIKAPPKSLLALFGGENSGP